MLAEAAAWYKHRGMDLCDVLEECYQKYGYYNESQTSIFLEGESGAARIREIMGALRKERISVIGDVPVILWQDFSTFEEGDADGVRELTGFTKSDVLKYFLDDGSWIAVRPSGTEPKIKIYYCICGKSAEDAEVMSAHYHDAMEALLA